MIGFIAIFGAYKEEMLVRAKIIMGPTLVIKTFGPLTFISTPMEMNGITPFWWDDSNGVVCGYADLLQQPQNLFEKGEGDIVINQIKHLSTRFCGVLINKNNTILFADPMATCRLFYAYINNGEMVCSSSARLLLYITGQKIEFMLPDGERPLPKLGNTLFKGVYAVPPRRQLVKNGSKAQWQMIEELDTLFNQDPEKRFLEMDLVVDEVYKCLLSSVKRLTWGVDSVAIPLSGGVDSSAVAGLARYLQVPKISTFTIGTSYGNEYTQAAEVAQILHSDHHELKMSCEDLKQLLPYLFILLETWDALTLQIAAPLVFIYRELARRNQKYVLTGYGADLLFAGTLDVKASGNWIERTIINQLNLTIPTNEFSPALGKWWGVTVRYPFWEPDVIRTALAIPGRMKVHKGIVKYPLRKAMEVILPQVVAWRTKRGIHEGASLHQLFKDILGEDTFAGQTQVLQAKAKSIFCSDQHLKLFHNQQLN